MKKAISFSLITTVIVSSLYSVNLIADEKPKEKPIPRVIIKTDRIHWNNFLNMDWWFQMSLYNQEIANFDPLADLGESTDDDDNSKADCEEGENPTSGEPVLYSSGTKYFTHQDITSYGSSSPSLTRNYNSNASFSSFGNGWTSNIEGKVLVRKYFQGTRYSCPANKECVDGSGDIKSVTFTIGGYGYTYFWVPDNNRWEDRKSESVSYAIQNANGSWTRYTGSGGFEAFSIPDGSGNGHLLSKVNN